MPLAIDLSGQRFGKLTAISATGERIKTSRVWLCKCDCGNIKIVSAEHLRSGDTQSCGCLRAERAAARSPNYIGRRFGKLLIIGKAPEGASGRRRWVCKCDCGVSKEIPESKFIYSKTGDCDCGCGGKAKIIAASRKRKGQKRGPSKRRIDLTGQRFGRWTVICDDRCESGLVYWKCKCDCGNERIVAGNSLRFGSSKSCGCIENGDGTFSRTDHGYSGTRVHNIWIGIVRRCTKDSQTGWENYGGRGITVCERWMKFENFLNDMGQPPSEFHSIDRIDNDGNYEPSNCRWATQTEQTRHTRRTAMLTIDGETRCVAEWSERLGVPYIKLWLKYKDQIKTGKRFLDPSLP